MSNILFFPSCFQFSVGHFDSFVPFDLILLFQKYDFARPEKNGRGCGGQKWGLKISDRGLMCLLERNDRVLWPKSSWNIIPFIVALLTHDRDHQDRLWDHKDRLRDHPQSGAGVGVGMLRGAGDSLI